MSECLVNSAYFGIALSLLAYWVGLNIFEKVKRSVANPILIASALIIAILLIFGIDYETYNQSASFLTYFLTPATVCLAVPLYRQFQVLRNNLEAVLMGIFSGCLACMVVILGLCMLFAFDLQLTASIMPKSITTAIALGLSEELGGIPGVTVVCVMISGIFGACIASKLFKVLKIEEPVAQGLAAGTASHAIGTSKALQMGEIQGAMGSVAIVVTGIITVLAAPIVMNLFVNF